MTKRISLLVVALACACRSGAPFEGLAPAHDTGGPRVQFDLTRKPFPEVPFPNDLMTRPDPSSPTGLRVNASLAAPTQLERNLRSRLDQLDGFGTFAPITVAFDPSAPDLDALDLFAVQNDSDLSNDAVYVVDVKTGKTFPLDFGAGLETRFPLQLPAPSAYFTNDPFAATTNLLFPTSGPFANLLQLPDRYGTTSPQDDDLLEFYERSTHTLILRPTVPLQQETTYAVILTQRLKDVAGRAVMPPGSGINHPAQTDELRPILSHLPAGMHLDDIAYLWAFTTQSTTRELELIDSGLQGSGRFARFQSQFPVAVPSLSFTNTQQTFMTLLPERDGADLTTPGAYTVTPADVEPLIQDWLQNPITAPALAPLTPAQLPALFDTFQYIDHFVSGTFYTPSMLDQTTPDVAVQDSAFEINVSTGNARAIQAPVTFLLAVPKPNADARALYHKQPFPVVIAGHEFGGSRLQMLAFAGTFAKFGLATIAIDAFGHGVALDATVGQPSFRALASQRGLGNFAAALLMTRAKDLDGDGTPDPGGDLFNANVFHTRDAIRQSAIDVIQVARLLRVFDGATVQTLGNTQVFPYAGDFDGDDVPDVGGPPVWAVDVGPHDQQGNVIQPPVYAKGSANPGIATYVFGESLGGLIAGIVPAVEPSITAAVSVSGGGGLSDILLRTQLPGVVPSFFLEVLGPFFATCPYSAAQRACSPSALDAQPTLVMVVRNLNDPERDLPVVPLALAPGDRVSVRNLAQLAADAPCSGNPLDGCATGVADANGAVRVAFAADAPAPPLSATGRGDPLRVEIQRASGQTQIVDSFGEAFAFQGVSYAPGDPLTAVGRGYGRTRNTPELRRIMQLVAAVLEPGDPISYSPYWFSQTLPARAGQPVPVLVVGTVGDPDVPVGTAISMARAAGLVETQAPDPAFGKPIDRVLFESGVVEGVARTMRFADPSQGPRALLPAGTIRCDTAASCSDSALLDPTDYSCNPDGSGCTDGFDAPRLNPPLREQLERAFPLPNGTTATAALLLPFVAATGHHGFGSPQPPPSGCSSPPPGGPSCFDMDQFLANLIGRWFATSGGAVQVQELHFEQCQQDLASCAWIPAPPP